MKYCSECGVRLQLQRIREDTRERLVCLVCNVIRYENPRILVATMLAYSDQLLLCRRAEPPSRGKWNPPSGFMEQGETLEQAAARETLEETGVHLKPDELDLYAVTSLSKISEVYVCFRGRVASNQCQASRESLEARFFSEHEIPWDSLAYPEMRGFIRLYFREHAERNFSIHLSRVDENGQFRSEYRLDPMMRNTSKVSLV
jgi:ADP-ribose pyrophosphatase YjhB (NUDIX family)